MPKITLEDGKTVNISQESYDELSKAVKKWEPKIGKRYYYFDGDEVNWDIWDDDEIDDRRLKLGNCFELEEEAEMYMLRIESLSWNVVPKDGEGFLIWNFSRNKPSELFERAPWTMDVKHETEERCQEWYDKFGKAWEYLNK